eukprot:scaffold5833_cov165-Amphora_coffeaeformis.AAC.19
MEITCLFEACGSHGPRRRETLLCRSTIFTRLLVLDENLYYGEKVESTRAELSFHRTGNCLLSGLRFSDPHKIGTRQRTGAPDDSLLSDLSFTLWASELSLESARFARNLVFSSQHWDQWGIRDLQFFSSHCALIVVGRSSHIQPDSFPSLGYAATYFGSKHFWPVTEKNNN